MTTSETVNEIAAALAKAQASMKNATLNKVNPHFKSKYADLAGIRDAVVPHLTANGIAVVQTLDGTAVMTRLLHTSGQWIESACLLPAVQDMQKYGSAITYARRYSLSAICGIAADEDDDANAASATNGKTADVPTVPAGYQDWLTDFMATADNGLDALRKMFSDTQKKNRTFTDYLVNHDNVKYEAIKARASKVKVPAHA